MTRTNGKLAGYREISLRVRFSEVDQYGVLWHGHAANYFECVRMDLAARFGLETPELAAADLMLPMLEVQSVYRTPCFEGDELRLQGSLLESSTESPFLVFIYRVVKASGQTAFIGRTRQVFARRNGRAVTRVPETIREKVRDLADYLASQPRWPDAHDVLRELGHPIAAA